MSGPTPYLKLPRSAPTGTVCPIYVQPFEGDNAPASGGNRRSPLVTAIDTPPP